MSTRQKEIKGAEMGVPIGGGSKAIFNVDKKVECNRIHHFLSNLRNNPDNHKAALVVEEAKGSGKRGQVFILLVNGMQQNLFVGYMEIGREMYNSGNAD